MCCLWYLLLLLLFLSVLLLLPFFRCIECYTWYRPQSRPTAVEALKQGTPSTHACFDSNSSITRADIFFVCDRERENITRRDDGSNECHALVVVHKSERRTIGWWVSSFDFEQTILIRVEQLAAMYQWPRQPISIRYAHNMFSTFKRIIRHHGLTLYWIHTIHTDTRIFYF